MKLHILKGDHNAAKILAFLKKLSINCEIRYLNPRTYSKDPNFLNISPEGKSPVLQTNFDSFCETNTILRYISKKNKEKGYSGVIPREEVKIDEWLDYCSRVIDPLVKKLIYLRKDFAHYKESEEELLQKMADQINFLQSTLGNRTYLVGYSATLADLSIVISFLYPMSEIYDESFKEQYPLFTEYLSVIKEEFSLEALPKFFKSLEFLEPNKQILDEARLDTDQSHKYSRKSTRGRRESREIEELFGGSEENQNFKTFMMETSKTLLEQIETLNKRMARLESRGGIMDNSVLEVEVKKTPRNPLIKKPKVSRVIQAADFSMESPLVNSNIINMTDKSTRVLLTGSAIKDNLFANKTTTNFYNYKPPTSQKVVASNTFESHFANNPARDDSLSKL